MLVRVSGKLAELLRIRCVWSNGRVRNGERWQKSENEGKASCQVKEHDFRCGEVRLLSTGELLYYIYKKIVQ